MKDNVKCLISWIFPILGVIFFITEKDKGNEFVISHTGQAATWFVLYIILNVALNLTGIALIVSLLPLVHVLIFIIAGMKAYNNQMYKVPLINEIAEATILKKKA